MKPKRAKKDTRTLTEVIRSGERLFPSLRHGPRGGIVQSTARPLVNRIDQVKMLFARFGWTACAFDPGIQFTYFDERRGDRVYGHFDQDQLLLLIPILEELVELHEDIVDIRRERDVQASALRFAAIVDEANKRR